MKSKTIVLVGCGAKKASFPCSAEAMYQGVLFKKALAYAKQMQPDKIYIISAKYHLLELGDDIEPYNETLNNKNASEIKRWSEIVLESLKEKGHELSNDKIIILAGQKYYKYLSANIRNCLLPYSNYKGIGYILQFLNNQLNN